MPPAQELELLFLASHPNRVFTPSAAGLVWGFGYRYGVTATVDVPIKRLRESWKASATVEPQDRLGVGYKFWRS